MDHVWLREAETEYNILDNKHDKGYKYLLSAKKVFIQLLKGFVHQDWTDKVDESNVVRIDKEFILQDFKNKEADLVYWVKLNDQDIILYILMEMQSSVDFQMPYRLLLYMVEIWRSFLKDTDEVQKKKKEFRLPPIIPIVLYNGDNNWTVCRSFKEYLSGYEMFADNIIDFEYILIDVKRYNEDELLKMSNLISSAFLIDGVKGLDNILEHIKNLGNKLKDMNTNDCELFMVWCKNIIMRNVKPDKYALFDKILNESKGVNDMVYSLDIAIREEMEKNREKGLEEGIKEGIKEGIIQGKIQAILELLQDLSDMPESLEVMIKQQKNIDILNKWLKAAARAQSIEEFQDRIKN